MKKKLLFLSAIALLTSISLSGCSFLSDITGGDDNPSGSEQGGNGGGNTTPVNQEKDVWTFQPKKMVLKNRVTLYQVDDAFVIPEVYVLDQDGNEHRATKGITISNKKSDDPKYDSSKALDVDMSQTTGEDSITVYVSYACIYDKGDMTSTKISYISSYPIRITPRRDSHYDPEDPEIKTLQVTDVYTSFYQGGEFVKPKVWAIKHDNSKVDITASCIFEGYDLSKYGYQTVDVLYNDHTISYEIVVHNMEEEEQYPFIINSLNMRLNIQNSLLVSTQKGQLYIMGYEKDGSITNYGFGMGHFIEGVTYVSDNTSVVTIDKDGIFCAVAPGSAFLYLTIKDVNGVDKYTLRTKITVEDKRLVELRVDTYKENYYSGHDVSFAGDVIAVYQNGYEEKVTPNVDLSDVDTNTPGKYNVVISYTVNGKTLSLNKSINILDSSLYVISKTTLGSGISDYNSNLRIPSIPTTGTTKSLVVPVKFTDSDDYITNYNNVREDIGKCFFGTNEDVGWRSVKTYYEEESHGLLTYTGKVSEIYNDTHSSNYYYYSNDDHTHTLKDNILDWYFTNHPEEDIRDYDVDGDGYFDSLNLVYLAPDAATSGVTRQVAPNLWAMVKANSFHSPDVDNPPSNRYFWASYDFIYPTKEIALARTGKSNYSAPANSSGNSNVGNEKLMARTFIHETGHMLGIDDYYSYSEDGVYFAGDKNMQTLNYMGHDPYSVMLYNWAEPYIPEISTTITIGDFQKTHDVILLTPEWNSVDSPFDEYFLLDLYVPTSGLNEFDATVKYPTDPSFNTVGVRLWHVDSRLATKASHFEDFTFDPTATGAHIITDNSYGETDDDDLEQYDRFMLLQLVRNVEDYDYATSGRLTADHYFQAGDTFSMSDFTTQFVNGNKMDNGKDLGWTVRIDGIYNSSEGYIADITVTKA